MSSVLAVVLSALHRLIHLMLIVYSGVDTVIPIYRWINQGEDRYSYLP